MLQMSLGGLLGGSRGQILIFALFEAAPDALTSFFMRWNLKKGTPSAPGVDVLKGIHENHDFLNLGRFSLSPSPSNTCAKFTSLRYKEVSKR